MNDHRIDTAYSFHGVNVVISCDYHAVSEALHARLRHFAMLHQVRPDIRFEIRRVRDQTLHVVQPPPGPVRVLAEDMAQRILYVPTTSQLYISYLDRIRVLCDSRLSHVRISLLESEVDNLWYLSHPLFTLPFIELMRQRGRYAVHAASLVADDRGLLIAGASGSGKSTLTITLTRAGFGFMGDDTVFLTQNDAGLLALAFPDEIDVTDQTAQLFPELARLLDQPKDPKWHKRQIWPEDVYGSAFVPQSRPTAIVFPRVGRAATSVVTPLDPGEALIELTSNIWLTDAPSTQQHLNILGHLVNNCGCYRLETGRDFDALPGMLLGILKESSSLQ